MCARVLLPAADDAEHGHGARLDRLERRDSIAGSVPPGRTPAAASPQAAPPAVSAVSAASPVPAQLPVPAPVPQPTVAEPARDAPAQSAAQAAQGPPAAVQPGKPEVADPGQPTGVDLITVRRLWPDVLSAVAAMKRTTWSFISQNASVRDVTNDRLTLSFSTAGLRDVFLSRSDHQDYVREALIQVLGVDWKVDAIVDPSGAPDPPPVETGANRPSQRPASTRGPAPDTASAGATSAASSEPAAGEPSADDPDADDVAVTHQDLLARELGAKVIGEYDAT